MLLATTMGEEKTAARVCGPDDLLLAQNLVRRIPVGEQVMEAILTLVRAARPDSDHASGVQGQIAWGPGPRAAQALMLACRARALVDGRFAPSVDDVLALAEHFLKKYAAANGAPDRPLSAVRHQVDLFRAQTAPPLTQRRRVRRLLRPETAVAAAVVAWAQGAATGSGHRTHARLPRGHDQADDALALALTADRLVTNLGPPADQDRRH